MIPLQEDYEDPQEFEANDMEKHIKKMETFTRKREEMIRATLDSGEMPPGVTGLIPDGSTKVAGVGKVKSLKKVQTISSTTLLLSATCRNLELILLKL